MGNTHQDAFEYGVLSTLGSAMAVEYRILITYSQQRLLDSSRQKCVHLEASVDLCEALKELQNFVVVVVGGIGGSSNAAKSSQSDD